MLAAKAKLAPATRALLMNAYLNFMDSVMRFWLNAWTEALMPSPNVFNRASVPSDQQPEKPYALDVGKAAPLFDIAAPLIDLHSLYEGGRGIISFRPRNKFFTSCLTLLSTLATLRETPSDGQGR